MLPSSYSEEMSSTSKDYNSPIKKRKRVEEGCDSDERESEKNVERGTQTRRFEEGDVDNKCRVCGVVHESEDDNASNSRWIGCDFKDDSGEACSYWAHEKCVGIYVMCESPVKKSKGKGVKGNSARSKGKAGKSFTVCVQITEIKILKSKMFFVSLIGEKKYVHSDNLVRIRIHAKFHNWKYYMYLFKSILIPTYSHPVLLSR